MKKVINQKFEAIMRILLAVTVIFTSFGYTTSVFAASIQKGDVRNEVNTVGSTTSAGDVELKKTVEKTDEEGIYKVTLTAKGKNKVTTESKYADIYTVVVLDTSGSMEKKVCVNRPFIRCKKWADIKYPEAVKGTKVFANTLLSKYSNAQLALLTFSSDVKKARDFDNKGFDNVNYPDPDGLTNLGAAIQTADQMLAEKKKSDTNAKLYMVILSDGYPERQTVNHTTAANHAKNVTGVEIFTIGYDTDEDTQKLLQGVATDKNHYSNADGNDVAQKFTDIAGSIEISVPAGTNATITDTIADGFTYVEGSGNNATIEGKKVSFDVDKITEEGETVSFKIKIDKDLPTDWYPTNDKADITYTDTSDATVTKTITNSAEVYWEQATYKYKVNYYKDSVNGTLLGTSEDEAVKNAKINASDIDINKYKPTGYGNGTIDTDMPYTMTGEDDVINVVYKKRNDLSYTVEYYKEQNKISNDNDNTVNNQTFGNKVQEAEIDKNKYKPLLGYKDGTIETDMPYEIKEEDNIIRVCYVKRDDMSYTVKYLDKANDEELLNSEVRDGKTFEEVYTETAKDAPYGYKLVGNNTQEVKIDAEDKVVIFYYEKDNTFGYKVNYLEKGTDKELAPQKNVTDKTYSETYTETAKTIKGYKVVGDNTQTFDLIRDGMQITFYYEKRDDLSYTVEYYKEQNKISNDNDNTVNNQTFGNKVQEAEIDKNKYKPLLGYKDGTIETDMPYEIKEEDNIIRVCYVKRDDMSYTVKYLDKANDEELFDSEVRDGKTFEEVYTETAKDAPYGYKLVGNDTQEVKIDAEDKVVVFYYEKRNDFKYSVKYLEEGTDKELADTEYRSNKTYLETYSEKAKNISGYNVVGEDTQEFVLREENMEIVFYYTKKADLSYKVVYYKDNLNTEAIGEEVVNNQTFESIINKEDINVDLYKPLKGYNSGVIATDMPYTIIDGENVINVIYTKKDNLTYRVEYYYDGNIDSSKTEYFENLTYGDVITNYKEKLPADYKFVNDTAPLTIDDTEDNVIKVYYESVSKGDVTPPKTGINNASYLSITCIIGMIALSLSKKKQEN